MKKIIVVSGSNAFKNIVSDQLNCNVDKLEFVYTPQEFLASIKIVDPQLIILDYAHVDNEDLIGYYTITRWYEIQMIVTNEKHNLSFSYLKN